MEVESQKRICHISLNVFIERINHVTVQQADLELA